MSNVQFMFFDHPIAAPIHEHWRKYILELLPEAARGRISVIEGAFEDIRGSSADFDCLVSPANSYGLMDGGLDAVFSRAFSGSGDDLELSRVVQAVLAEKYFGFAPPTTCTLVPIPKRLQNPQYPKCEVLAVSPTMRVPTNMQWHEDLAYNTMWALLVEIEHWNQNASDSEKIVKVATAGFATGIGMYDKERCARQMVLALKHFLEVRSEEGKARLADRTWMTDWDNIIPNAVEVTWDD